MTSLSRALAHLAALISVLPSFGFALWIVLCLLSFRDADKRNRQVKKSFNDTDNTLVSSQLFV